MSTKPISDEAVRAAVEALAAATMADFYALPKHDQDRLTREVRAAIAAADAIREKEGRAVTEREQEGSTDPEMPLANSYENLWKIACEQEGAKFRAETLRSSELASMLRRCVDLFHPEHTPGPWSRGCVRCALMQEALDLLAKPINVVEREQEEQPAGGAGEVPCSKHPLAPHGFNRNASHTEDRYVCDCEGWIPDEVTLRAQAAQGDAVCTQYRKGSPCPTPDSCRENGCDAVERKMFTCPPAQAVPEQKP